MNPILDDTAADVTYLEPGLISHLRYRLEDLGGSIVVEDAWHPTLRREGDVSIMEKLIQLPGVKKSQLQHANQCRKWMRVITIAELAALDGTQIPPERFTGRWRAKSNLRWARQRAPTAEMWKIFRILVKRAFCKGDIRAQHNQKVKLNSPLGAWYQGEGHIEYEVYRSRNVIFAGQEDAGPSMYQRLITTPDRNYFMEEGVTHKLPIEIHPISLTQSSTDKWIADHEYNLTINHSQIEEKRGDEVDEDTSEEEIEILRQADRLIACSDGSFDPIECKAAFNWRIVTAEDEGLTTASAPVNTNPKYLNSYRAEFAGLRRLIRYLRNNNLHEKSITIHCDIESCIKILKKGPRTGSLMDLEKAESDIIAV